MKIAHRAQRVFMSFVHITPATKLAAVKLYWQTGNVLKCANEYGVSRNTVYDWVRLAEQNLEKLFLESTPGRKPPTLAEQKETLQSQLEHVLDAYHNLSQSPHPLAQDLARCPNCHSTTLLRNGRVRSKRHGLLQRLWCRQCNASVYVDLKKTLLSPAWKSVALPTRLPIFSLPGLSACSP